MTRSSTNKAGKDQDLEGVYVDASDGSDSEISSENERVVKEKADTFILAEGFGRRITFIDIFLGLLVIVLLFRLKK